MIVVDYIIVALLMIGAVFMLIGSYGLLKLDNPMSRLHAPTKAATLGIGALLLAAMVNSFAHGEGSVQQLLVMAFLFVTAPITGNFIAKTHLHRLRARQDLPPPPSDKVWATDAKN